MSSSRQVAKEASAERSEFLEQVATLRKTVSSEFQAENRVRRRRSSSKQQQLPQIDESQPSKRAAHRTSEIRDNRREVLAAARRKSDAKA